MAVFAAGIMLTGVANADPQNASETRSETCIVYHGTITQDDGNVFVVRDDRLDLSTPKRELVTFNTCGTETIEDDIPLTVGRIRL